MTKNNINIEYWCPECYQETKPDEWACKCMCINCGPCENQCKKEVNNEVKSKNRASKTKKEKRRS